SYRWADSQWQAGAETINKTAGPARQRKHEDDKRQQCCARGSRRVTLNLNQVEREEEKHSAQGGIQKQCQDIRAGEVSTAKETQRHHRIFCAGLVENEGSERH